MKKRHLIHNILLYSVLAVYIFILFTLLFMKKQEFRSINILPFHSINNYLFSDDIILRSFALSNVLGNIILFIPLGGYLMLFNRDKRIWKNVLYIILFSVSAEVIQYVFKLGATDIDDIILNGLGGGAGVVAYKILLLIFKKDEIVRYVIEILAPTIGIMFFFVLFLYNRA